MKLLLVEDSVRLRESLSHGLAKAGYVVEMAPDGEEALWQIQNGSFDLVILDWMLPKLDGFEVLQKMRSLGIDTHVLMLTVKENVEDLVSGLRAGADDYVVKPFVFAELLARVEALLRRQYGRKSSFIKFKEFELNTSGKTLLRKGEPVSLTPREYRVLEFLVLKAGEVVSKAEIEAHVYADEQELFSNVVESTVSTLRKKLEGVSSLPIIQTRRGLGYLVEK